MMAMFKMKRMMRMMRMMTIKTTMAMMETLLRCDNIRLIKTLILLQQIVSKALTLAHLYDEVAIWKLQRNVRWPE